MRSELRFALVFTATCFASAYLHEIGHALLGLVQGIAVIPTPAKEYELCDVVDWRQMKGIALGGVLTSAILTAAAIFCYLWRRTGQANAFLGGMLVLPGLYTLRFILAGRGHDGLEFQEAQAALGFSPSGHSFDFVFLVLFGLGCAVMYVRNSHAMRMKSVLRIFSYSLLGVILLITVQVANNALFDRHFPRTRTVNVPVGLESETR